MSVTSDEVNFLVYRYLQESGKGADTPGSRSGDSRRPRAHPPGCEGRGAEDGGGRGAGAAPAWVGSSSPPRFCSVGLDGREHRRPTPEWASPSFPKPSGGFLLLSTPLVMPKSVLEAELRTGPVGTERSRPRGLERGRGARGVWGLASSQARGCPTRVLGREGPPPASPPADSQPGQHGRPRCVKVLASSFCPVHFVTF